MSSRCRSNYTKMLSYSSNQPPALLFKQTMLAKMLSSSKACGHFYFTWLRAIAGKQSVPSKALALSLYPDNLYILSGLSPGDSVSENAIILFMLTALQLRL
ncbi:hypothetical protein MTBPR1_100054 [Candidatus Terasakiella magnetica]|uniref:Uncharacterized protein n=1 Tax=Candidatus Terasakiella magnetica TaxID=1867952 RepID=A0A1C3RDP3_9PROT|nr:hypothetical protein MTBPR1_100054 [Candidatus Terasakiella magnetica]